LPEKLTGTLKKEPVFQYPFCFHSAGGNECRRACEDSADQDVHLPYPLSCGHRRCQVLVENDLFLNQAGRPSGDHRAHVTVRDSCTAGPAPFFTRTEASVSPLSTARTVSNCLKP